VADASRAIAASSTATLNSRRINRPMTAVYNTIADASFLNSTSRSAFVRTAVMTLLFRRA
jgi:hypothetical protein